MALVAISLSPTHCTSMPGNMALNALGIQSTSPCCVPQTITCPSVLALSYSALTAGLSCQAACAERVSSGTSGNPSIALTKVLRSCFMDFSLGYFVEIFIRLPRPEYRSLERAYHDGDRSALVEIEISRHRHAQRQAGAEIDLALDVAALERQAPHMAVQHIVGALRRSRDHRELFRPQHDADFLAFGEGHART